MRLLSLVDESEYWYYFDINLALDHHELYGTAVPGHVRPNGTDSGPRQFPSKFRNSLRLISTFHILERQYMESTSTNLIINTSPLL